MQLVKPVITIVNLIVRTLAPNEYYRMILGNTRPMIAHVKKHFTTRPLVGAEIGVASGQNAMDILDTLKIERLYLIDPYEVYAEDGKIVDQYAKLFDFAVSRLTCYWDKIVFLKAKSSEAAQFIPDGSLDFCYIDGCHEYEAVKSDILSYYEKVKIGGVLGGHDYFKDFRGLQTAVKEVTKLKGLHLNVRGHDWFLVREK